MAKSVALSIVLISAIGLCNHAPVRPSVASRVSLELRIVSKAHLFSDSRIELRVRNSTFKSIMVVRKPRFWQHLAAYFKDKNNKSIGLRANGPVAQIPEVQALDFVSLAPSHSIVWSYLWADEFRDVKAAQRYRLSFEYNTKEKTFARDPGFHDWKHVIYSNPVDVELSPGKVIVHNGHARTKTIRNR
jgi:hypothetical protein